MLGSGVLGCRAAPSRGGSELRSRLSANADNVVSVFQKLADGIDIWVFENFDYGKEKLLSASGASRLPDRRESETLARAYVAFLDSPRR